MEPVKHPSREQLITHGQRETWMDWPGRSVGRSFVACWLRYLSMYVLFGTSSRRATNQDH